MHSTSAYQPQTVLSLAEMNPHPHLPPTPPNNRNAPRIVPESNLDVHIRSTPLMAFLTCLELNRSATLNRLSAGCYPCPAENWAGPVEITPIASKTRNCRSVIY